ncbi:TIGR02206 family membrane protein [Bacillus alkalicellulosilyticus]|uniref:YwaF family protein n=1 Tax=Alkalihalobacterium alkalicellulosilyticum TaxID=1912214 RepID=UPI001FE4B630|nr:TIGR02206 family membrane protein [Bacillus alkalicellulosilyticus]
MREYFTVERGLFPFEMFSVSHFMVVVLLVACSLLLFFYRFKIRHTKTSSFIKYSLVFLLVVSEVSFQLWYVVHGHWTIRNNLPLQLCSISMYLATFMLFTKNKTVTEITFFFGIGGAVQAMVTPELFYGFPHFRFFHFFIAHIAIILACLHMVWIHQFRPTYKSVLKAMLALNLIAVFVFIINKLLDTNYMFLAQKPRNPTIIDVLGPYPWYILSLEVIAFVLFNLIYFIFRAKKKE